MQRSAFVALTIHDLALVQIVRSCMCAETYMNVLSSTPAVDERGTYSDATLLRCERWSSSLPGWLPRAETWKLAWFIINLTANSGATVPAHRLTPQPSQPSQPPEPGNSPTNVSCRQPSVTCLAQR
ncbi:hypothetical protein GGR57DRAFT_475458 [Xylariaceae sp. FL1272]|nr:hypothetical protein GGR57DRAFT_475458 [Xylariaceae sp. FL1272]